MMSTMLHEIRYEVIYPLLGLLNAFFSLPLTHTILSKVCLNTRSGIPVPQEPHE
jgi:hypothetical protein